MGGDAAGSTFYALPGKRFFDIVPEVTDHRRRAHQAPMTLCRNPGILHDPAVAELHLEHAIALIVPHRTNRTGADFFPIHTLRLYLTSGITLCKTGSLLIKNPASKVFDPIDKHRRPIVATLRLGDIAPDFTQESTHGTIKFHQWAGNNWVVLFSHPKDFTPVCTTELGYTAKLKSEFDKRGVKAIAVSVDPLDSHHKWIGDIEETQNTKLNFPILADADKKVSNLYDMIHPNANDTLTVRSVFIIDPNKKIRTTLTYPASTGRNFDEILRVIDSLQLTDRYSVATPVNWKDGDDVVIVPSIQDPEVIKQKFPKGYKAVKPYLRITPQPNR
jgi:thioredoxin-dependent peroxiredoxin